MGYTAKLWAVQNIPGQKKSQHLWPPYCLILYFLPPNSHTSCTNCPLYTGHMNIMPEIPTTPWYCMHFCLLPCNSLHTSLLYIVETLTSRSLHVFLVLVQASSGYLAYRPDHRAHCHTLLSSILLLCILLTVIPSILHILHVTPSILHGWTYCPLSYPQYSSPAYISHRHTFHPTHLHMLAVIIPTILSLQQIACDAVQTKEL